MKKEIRSAAMMYALDLIEFPQLAELCDSRAELVEAYEYSKEVGEIYDLECELRRKRLEEIDRSWALLDMKKSRYDQMEVDIAYEAANYIEYEYDYFRACCEADDTPTNREIKIIMLGREFGERAKAKYPDRNIPWDLVELKSRFFREYGLSMSERSIFCNSFNDVFYN